MVFKCIYTQRRIFCYSREYIPVYIRFQLMTSNTIYIAYTYNGWTKKSGPLQL